MSQQQHGRTGKVFLVGAGPGDPGLITLRGVECLAQADLVLHDWLVNPAILRHANPAAEIACLGSHGPGATQRVIPQDEVNAQMIRAAQQGKTVVRLKGGDPDVFGRSAEEIEALDAAGIPVETVPGVTAALAAAGYAGIPITHGQHCSAVALVTGHERHDKMGPPLDYGALAQFPGTLVFYMGVATAPHWSQALITEGKPPETPVAIVRRCSLPDQQTIRCTLATLPETIAEHRLGPPAVIIIGQAVTLATDVSWFASRPLFGQCVLVTRPKDQAGPLWQRLADLGAEVLQQPAIQISDPADWDPVDAALKRLDRYDWLVFSSVNGVRYLLDRLCDDGGDLRRLGHMKLAAIGPATADELGRYRLQADLMPQQYRAESLADELVAKAAGERFLLARASRGREVLAETLTAAGSTVDQIVVYSSTDVREAEPEVAAAMSAGRIDWVTVTSSAIARSLAELFGEQLHQTKLASISPITSGTLRELGFEPAVEAAEYTMDGLMEVMLANHEGTVQ